MGARGLAKRLWDRMLRPKTLGRIVITFYPPGRQASITLSPSLDTLSRHDWHRVYLQHLAESLGALEEQEAVRLLVAARALAEDFVSSSYWPQMTGETIPDALAGAAEVVPEQPGGTALVAEVCRGSTTPRVRLAGSPPHARERLASSNLVLLVHMMTRAADAHERDQAFKEITLFAEYCERVGYRHDQTTPVIGSSRAVMGADIVDIMLPAGQPVMERTGPRGGIVHRVPEDASPRPDRPAAPSAPVSTSPSRVPRPGPRPWERPVVAISVGVLLWVGLILAAFLVPRDGGGPPVSTPNAGVPPDAGTREASRTQEPATGPMSAAEAPPASNVHRASSQATGRSRDASGVRRSARTPLAPPEAEESGVPRFRVVSGMLSRQVAELRARTLADQGADAFVWLMSGRVAQLQYGAYRSRMNAEAEAWRLRAQGYTAVIVPW